MLPYLHHSPRSSSWRPASHLTSGHVSPSPSSSPFPAGRIRAPHRPAPALSWPAVLIAALLLALALGPRPVSASSDSDTLLLPYIPTTLLVPASTSGNITSAYLFSPTGDSVDLLLLDISSTLASSSPAVSTLTSGLPFVSSSSNTATFTSTLALDGSIIVFAGDCASDSGSSVWIYNTTSTPTSWKEHNVTSSRGTTGPQFLGSSIAFSETISPSIATPEIYSYGGQCPAPKSSINGSIWINAADYSNAMVRLTPSADAYEATTMSLKAPPIAEAGFSFTQLLPSTSSISGTVTQDVNSVVLGGHTQGAFVNMSTAAVWALPEATWSFISISGPSSTASSSSSDTSELAKNKAEAVQVQSRSGHTAVLSDNGTKLVVLGGWVGDTTQAAEPQLAILQMSENEYGEWTWSVPDDQPLAGGDGIYGHGAALLPGNVMMVVGGYAISSSSSSSNSRLSRRDGISVAGGQLQMFFNLTSLTWADTYTNPSSINPSSDSDSGHSSPSPSSSSPSPSSSPASRLGLGLGLGLGIPLLLLLLAVAFFCVRRSRRHRHKNRDEQVRNLTTGAAFITSEEMLEAEHEGVYSWGPRGASQWYNFYTGGHDPYMRENQYENLRGQQQGQNAAGGSAADQPDGYRGSNRRKRVPRMAKGLYQPTGVDDSRAMAVISPILEDEEDEVSVHGGISPDKEMEGNEDDPFVTPMEESPRRSTYPQPGERSTILFVAPSPSPTPTTPEPRTPTQPPQPQHPEVQDWITDLDVSDALINQRLQPSGPNVTTIRPQFSSSRRQSVRFSDGEITPTGGGARTQSDLSDRSAFSFTLNRADSLRLPNTNRSSPDHLANFQSHARGGTSHSDSSSGGNTTSSYATAKSVSALQQEGPGLLAFGRPRAISAIEDVADADWDNGEPGSPSKSKAPRRSWFGSLRRVFSGGHSNDSGSSGSVRTHSPAHGESSDYERLGPLGSLGAGLGPGGVLQKRKQGRSAWAAAGGNGEGAAAAASSPGGGAGGGGGEEEWDEEDWDVERAVEQRLVQVMFSVPKERLRIVNGEPDIISIAESAVIVDPSRDGEEGEEEDGGEGAGLLVVAGDKGKGKERAEAGGEQAGASSGAGYAPFPQLSSSSSQQRRDDKGGEKADESWDIKGKEGKSIEEKEEEEVTPTKQHPKSRRPLLLIVSPPQPQPQLPGSDAGLDTPRRTSSPGVPMTAEAVRFERPPSTPRLKSKVQEMIDSLEQRSRSSSPVKDGFSSSFV